MTVRECYAMIGGDYDGVFSRFRGEERIKKFAFKFLNDKSFETLEASMAEGAREEAFRAAHTLKGVSQNLGFTRLYKSSDAITEALRGGQDAEAAALLPRVEEDYRLTYEGICALKES